MTITTDAWFKSILQCPDCGGAVEIQVMISCNSCGYESTITDLRPAKPEAAAVRYSRLMKTDISSTLAAVDTTRPSEDFDGPLAQRDSRAFMKLISEHCAIRSKVLDLGCGPRDQAEPLEWLGYNYVGVDYLSQRADFLADAHSLPFKNESFDCVFSYAVLEHLHQPFIALQEINRVLKGGGIYVGTVSLGEPFHDSYFHHTPWGFLSLMSHASDLKPERLWASMDTLRSLSNMGRYPRVIQLILGMVDFVHRRLPMLAPRKRSWNDKEKELDALFRAGSVCFLCRKMNPEST